ncbi:MAG: glycosyltransferase family 2 protein [Candidatus Omnitrophica bacterium]|nr:glycosyltransferase family 2 protein [Candidatus Omnitrophota bacterium]
MIGGRKVIVVLPAYNAERTLERTYRGIPRDVVDDILLVDDGSRDRTVAVAESLGIPVYRHAANRGYGGNQKTCYQAALDRGADIVVMVHPDYQYPPERIPELAGLVASGHVHVALGSRILGGGAVRRGMPWYKYLSNRLWTWGQNLCLGQRLSEYHTGFRAFSREFLSRVPLLENSDDFLFDNQLLVQAVAFGYRIGELPTPATFSHDASSISVWRGTWYGLGVAAATWEYLGHRAGWWRSRRFDPAGRRLTVRAEVLA